MSSKTRKGLPGCRPPSVFTVLAELFSGRGCSRLTCPCGALASSLFASQPDTVTFYNFSNLSRIKKNVLVLDGVSWSTEDFESFSFLLIEVQLIHNVALVSTLQEDSVYCIYITFSCLLHCGLLQNVERSSLCYPGGPSVYFACSSVYLLISNF